jgi:hypothetical protein
MAEIAALQQRQTAWQAAVSARTVEAYLQDGRVTVINHSGPIAVPITVPAGTRTVTLSLLGIELLGGPYGAAYGGERSDWTTLGGLQPQLLLRLPS